MSTGNDIVALAVTDKDRTSRYRFYSRILSPVELSLYDQLTGGGVSFPFDPLNGTRLSFPSFVWLLWSIKESVYKYVSRSNPQLVFSPLKIPVSRLGRRDDFYEGMIRYGQVILHSRSFLTSETIMTVVSDDPEFSHTRWGIHSIDAADYASQSSRVRALALNSISEILPGAAIRIVKTPDGPPVLRADDLLPDIPLSLAHHGHYVAYSYCLTANSSSYRKSAAN
jgi:phosphopantetheinyl transferase (holo-ACP synthase)